ncbi:MAG: NAAT family transporter [Phycisphaerae bacterium]|nr:NAAT family transporter [Phycisphaerae bacterium]
MDDYTEYLKILVSIFALVSPMSAIPVFIGLTDGMTKAQQKHVGHVSSISVAIILIISVIVGEPLLNFFGISMGAFRMAGGLLVLLMGIAMMHGHISQAKRTPSEAKEAQFKDTVSVVPLAIPIMAGPGAISMMIVSSHQVQGLTGKMVLVGISFIVALTVWIALRLAGPISRFLGNTGINIIARVMGLILASVGIELLVTGIKQLFPSLG